MNEPQAEPRIRGRGHALPFSKGRMATTLYLSGIEAEHAYELAIEIDRSVHEDGASEIPLERLHDLVGEVLGRLEGPDAVARYRAWQQVLHLERPLVLLLGGATGTGKSSLATELAYRLGISRITSTDVVRQVMRAFFAPALMPTLHTSSFEAGEVLRRAVQPDDERERALVGFIQQADQVAVGAAAVVDRAVVEGLSTVIEGVHLVPGLVSPDPVPRAVVVQVLLTIPDETAHQAHFVARDRTSGQERALHRYLDRFEDIRRVQDYLVSRAERAGIPVVDATDADQALRAVLDLILEQATGGSRE